MTTTRYDDPVRDVAGPLAGRTILLADDVAAIRHIYGTALRRAGADVLPASDGAAAVETWRTAHRSGRRIDAVVLDYAMPRMDGLAVIAALRGEGFDGGAVGVSAEATPHEEASWIWAGCDVVFRKGISLADLVAEVAYAADRRDGPAATDG